MTSDRKCPPCDDTAEPDERTEAESRRDTSVSGAARRKQEAEGDERKAECGVTGDEGAVSLAFRGGQRRRREAVQSAESFDLGGPRTSPMIF